MHAQVARSDSSPPNGEVSARTLDANIKSLHAYATIQEARCRIAGTRPFTGNVRRPGETRLPHYRTESRSERTAWKLPKDTKSSPAPLEVRSKLEKRDHNSRAC